ncbi:MAG: DNA-binding transcriptional regulator [Planctomycetota bacterium]
MQKRVAILIHPGRSWGRGLLSGIALFARGNRTWSVFHDERQFTSTLPEWLKSWNGDGVIAAIDSEPLAGFVADRGLPTVDVLGAIPVAGVPRVRERNDEVIRLAVRHLQELGLRSFAYCGFRGFRYSEEREQAIRELAIDEGFPLSVLDSPFDHTKGRPAFEGEGLRHQSELLDWLQQLPLPVGLVACNDVRALQVLSAAREAGLRAPDDIAVVGIDNDEVICGLADPPLSSVDLDTMRIGHRAAATLARLMDGHAAAADETLIDPSGIVARQSSDLLAIADPEIAAVAQFIRDNACDGIAVTDVVETASIARSTLERRFRKSVGRSIKAEINRVRIKRIKELLASTPDNLSTIAQRTGFEHAEYMCTLFKKQVDMTPGQYRREHGTLF